MSDNERIVSFTAEELERIRQRGEDRSNLQALRQMTEEVLEASIDIEEEGETDWTSAQIGIPLPKQQITLRIDPVVIDFFRSGGPGYQTRINAVLRSYVEAQKKAS